MSDTGFTKGHDYESDKPPAQGDGDGYGARELLMEIKAAEEYLSKWRERAKKIIKLYTRQGENTATVERKYAMLWSNTEVLKEAVYTRQPAPVVARRFTDRDPTARHVAEVLERGIGSMFDQYDVHHVLEKCRDDYLLAGRGTPWVRYEADIEPQDYGEAGEVDTVTDEKVCYDHVHWSDFLHPKARSWDDLPWVGRRVWLSKAKGQERFGEDVWREVGRQARVRAAAEYISGHSYDSRSTRDNTKTPVYEIWHKHRRKVCWVADGYDKYLDEKPPLLTLRGFFPCPRPAYATLPTDSLIPIPDYVYYQDQAEEIDDLTKKISDLTDALKLVGFYPSGAEGGISEALEKAFKGSVSNTMVPIAAYSRFQQQGGVSKLVEWWPVEKVIEVLRSAVELRRQLIDDVYQITGISDILRGDTEATETLGAQQLKAQWGGLRIRSRQTTIARVAKELAYITAEVLSEQFAPETLWRITGLRFPTEQEQGTLKLKAEAQQPVASNGQSLQSDLTDEEKRMLGLPTQEAIIKLLRDDAMRGYRIDIETDSTVQPDEQAEKAARNEFLEVVGGFMERAMPMAQQAPELVPVMGEMLMFVVRGYRTGRQLEEIVQEMVDELTEKAKQARAAPPPPDPELEKIKVDRNFRERETQVKERDVKVKEDKNFMDKDAAAHQRLLDGMPDGQSFVEMLAGMQAALEVIDERLAQTSDTVQQVAAYQAAPVEVVRDQSGRAVGVSKGGVQRPITRGPDGKVVGLQ